MAFDATLARRIRSLLDVRRDLVEKHMFGGVCFMIRGRMCCGIIDDALMVRLDRAEADLVADEPHVRPMDFTGKPMPGYLFVDAEGIASPKALKTWIDRCVRHVESMPVKRQTAKARRRRARANSRTRPAS
jgi:TfoX/Sxy family transcriptional regulator of competence genes